MVATTRKAPERQCVGCQEQRPKRSMVRVVLTPTGEIVLDATGKRNGRGAYICPRRECFDQAKKRKALDRGLKTAVPAEVYEELLRTVEVKEVHG